MKIKDSSTPHVTTLEQSETSKPASKMASDRKTGVVDAHEDPHTKAADTAGAQSNAVLNVPTKSKGVKGSVTVPPMKTDAAGSALSEKAGAVWSTYQRAPIDRQDHVLDALSDFNKLISETYG